MSELTPTRTAALARLDAFLPRAGRDYAALRNYDRPGHPHVSGLSPYIKTRLLTEEEVLEAVIAGHGEKSAEKFIQEVFWRTYWKGWLEQRPGVWSAYRRDLDAALNRVQTESGLRLAWEDACNGHTGNPAFDHWAQELVQTGYLHNHARMWFSSIWIFTLRLPWELGADFFLRHLLDGDAASNTLSWKWVAGLQTTGKNYAARASNIEKYTDGKFGPGLDLAENPAPLLGPPHPERSELRPSMVPTPGMRTGVLITDDDLSLGRILADVDPVAIGYVSTVHMRSPLQVSETLAGFSQGGLVDTAARYDGEADQEQLSIDNLADWVARHEIAQIVMPYQTVGPGRDSLEIAKSKMPDLPVVEIKSYYDDISWPSATAGFFKFRKAIPKILENLKSPAFI